MKQHTKLTFLLIHIGVAVTLFLIGNLLITVPQWTSAANYSQARSLTVISATLFTLGTLVLILTAYVDFYIFKYSIFKFLRNLRKNRRAVTWIWAVCAISIVIYSITWFALTAVWNIFLEAMLANFTFESPMDVTVDFMQTVIAWHPVLMILGMLLWAYVNSQRREDVTYPR